jgi:hypothetical protein
MLVFLFDLDDKLTRVQPLIDHVRRVSQDIFQRYEKIAVDERMAFVISVNLKFFFPQIDKKKLWYTQ